MRNRLLLPVLALLVASSGCSDDTKPPTSTADAMADVNADITVDGGNDASPSDTPATDTQPTDAPITDTPVTDAPITDVPVADAPTDVPVIDLFVMNFVTVYNKKLKNHTLQADGYTNFADAYLE